MAMQKVAFIGGAYSARSVNVDLQECVNLYPEINDANSKNVSSLVTTPGYELFATMHGLSGCRGLFVSSSGRFFGVCGGTLNEILLDGTCISRGALSTIVGDKVSIDENGNQLIMADGRFGYILDLKDWVDASTGVSHTANTFTQIVDGDVEISGVTVTSAFPKATHVVFKDGFFVANNKDTGQFFVSRSYDGSVWDASFYATAEGSPDNLLSILHTNNELWMFGDNSTEVWYTTGDTDFPFQRINGAFIDIGTDARNSPASNGSICFWLGSNDRGHGTVWMSQGFNPQRISTHAIEYLIGQMTRIDDAIGWCYQQEGHVFYVLSFPTGNRTLVFDLNTALWHERGEWSGAYGKMNMWLPVYHVLWEQTDYVGDVETGNIYKMSLDIGTNNNNTIRRVRTFPHLHNNRKRLFFRELEIDMQKGIANQAIDDLPSTDKPFVVESIAGSDPHIALQMSDDGGYTWGNEYWHGSGKIGQHSERAHWHRLGASRDRVFRVIYTSSIPTTFISALAEISEEV